MRKKLYEFSVLIQGSVVVAANSEADAYKEIDVNDPTLFEGVLETIKLIELIDVRKPKSPDLNDEADVIA